MAAGFAYLTIGQTLGLGLLLVLCRRWRASVRESAVILFWVLVLNGIAYFSVARPIIEWAVALRPQSSH